MAERIATRTTADWQAILDSADIPNGRVHELEDLLSDDYLAATGFFVDYEHPSEGPMTTASIPVRYSRTPGNVRRAPPRLGEHTAEVLAEAGLTPGEIAALAS